MGFTRREAFISALIPSYTRQPDRHRANKHRQLRARQFSNMVFRTWRWMDGK